MKSSESLASANNRGVEKNSGENSEEGLAEWE
jgi:hypothetical protein